MLKDGQAELVAGWQWPQISNTLVRETGGRTAGWMGTGEACLQDVLEGEADDEGDAEPRAVCGIGNGDGSLLDRRRMPVSISSPSLFSFECGGSEDVSHGCSGPVGHGGGPL